MLHYEFQCAVSDSDIGRAMNVMAVDVNYNLYREIGSYFTALGVGILRAIAS